MPGYMSRSPVDLPSDRGWGLTEKVREEVQRKSVSAWRSLKFSAVPRPSFLFLHISPETGSGFGRDALPTVSETSRRSAFGDGFLERYDLRHFAAGDRNGKRLAILDLGEP